MRERVPFSFQYRELKGPFRLGGGVPISEFVFELFSACSFV